MAAGFTTCETWESQNPPYLVGGHTTLEGRRKVQDRKGCQVFMKPQINTDHGIIGIIVNIL